MSEDTPTAPPAKGTKTPEKAKSAPDDDLDDLFSDPDKDAGAAPVEPAAKTAVATNIEPAAGLDDSEDLATDTGDDMPALDEKDSAKPAGDEFDDLFEEESNPGAGSAAQENAPVEQLTADDPAPADAVDAEEPAEQSAADEESMSDETAQATPSTPTDANGSNTVGAEARDQAASSEMRVWTDSTGNFTVRARLVVVFDGHVRLQKETGRFTTVPLERLSKPDLAFVESHVVSIASTSVDRGF